jgi:hypothetical protein
MTHPATARRPAGPPARRFRLAVALTAALVTPVAAQDLDAACRALRTPTVGLWAQYVVKSGAQPDSTVLRLAFVAEERMDGAAHVWQETVIAAAGTETVIQSLVPTDPYDPTAIRRAVLRLPGRAAMEVRPQALQAMRGSTHEPQALDACNRGEALGSESVAVPAGTFRAIRVRYSRDGRTAESWLVPTVPLALARSVVTDAATGARMELVLVAHGRDATPTVPLPPARTP